MTTAETDMLRLYEDPDRLGEALNFTEAETTFAARLVEKDYYGTVVLDYLAGKAPALVFKGGTFTAGSCGPRLLRPRLRGAQVRAAS